MDADKDMRKRYILALALEGDIVAHVSCSILLNQVRGPSGFIRNCALAVR